MIKYIKDYENTGGKLQYNKMLEEVLEAKVEFEFENKENEIQELCDIVQTVYTRFNQLGMRLEDISQAMTKHYEKETLRGRVVVDIEGKDYKDNIISELLDKIAELEKFIASGHDTPKESDNIYNVDLTMDIEIKCCDCHKVIKQLPILSCCDCNNKMCYECKKKNSQCPECENDDFC